MKFTALALAVAALIVAVTAVTFAPRNRVPTAPTDLQAPAVSPKGRPTVTTQVEKRKAKPKAVAAICGEEADPTGADDRCAEGRGSGDRGGDDASDDRSP
jgi:hypothetical protein